MKQFMGGSNDSASASRDYRRWTSCSGGRQRGQSVFFSGSSSVGMADTVVSSSACGMERRCAWSECARHFKEGM